jgi:rfaE bifunctional protein nucleotidyltransferase chain/domain
MSSKATTLSQLQQIRLRLKRQGKKVVLTYGTFDTFHLGIVDYLQKAKAQGDVLVVLVSSDKAIRSHLPQRRRISALQALTCVDHIALFDDMIPTKEIELLRPDVYCDTMDWGHACKERNIVKRYGGTMKVLPVTPDPFLASLIHETFNTDPEATPAIFLDRDETINKNKAGFITRPEDFHFLPGALDALKKVVSEKYKIVIITNQAGIDRGIFTHQDLKRVHQKMVRELKKAGVTLDGIYYCPHHPKNLCLCRKPGIGLLLKAANDLRINLAESWFVGDKHLDSLTGHYAGMRAIKLGPKVHGTQPDFYARDLKEAITIILTQKQR